MAEKADVRLAVQKVGDRDDLAELREIRMRLDAIEHATEVLVRAQDDQIWPPLEKRFRADPMLAEIYLLIGGSLSQREIVTALKAKGHAVHEATVSRRIATLRDLALVQLVEGTTKGNVYTTVRLEKILHIKKRVERLLDVSKARDSNETR